jgi:uncharacterized delta-60 repeat protein
VVAVTLVFLASNSQRAFAAPGALDSTFSGDGKVATDLGSGDEGANAVAVQSDGKIVVAGYTFTTAFEADFILARYNTDGTPDPTFSGDGLVTSTSGVNTIDLAVDLAIQSDGKLLVFGSGVGLARYNPDGTPDTSFSDDGVQHDGLAGVSPGGLALGGGKIVVVGTFQTPSLFLDFFVARYSLDGTLDATFSGDGLQTTSFSRGDRAEAVAVRGNGKIVVAGWSTGSRGRADFAVARFRLDGTLDPTFSGDGKQETSFALVDRARDLRIQGDGKILVVGQSALVGQSTDFALARYRPNGRLDRTFSGDGRQRTNFGAAEASAEGLVIQPNGRIVVAGYAGSGPRVALARYRPNGNPDSAFSGDGKLTTAVSVHSYGWDVARQADGRIVVAGQGASGPYDVILVRYLG